MRLIFRKSTDGISLGHSPARSSIIFFSTALKIWCRHNIYTKIIDTINSTCEQRRKNQVFAFDTGQLELYSWKSLRHLLHQNKIHCFIVLGHAQTNRQLIRHMFVTCVQFEMTREKLLYDSLCDTKIFNGKNLRHLPSQLYEGVIL